MARSKSPAKDSSSNHGFEADREMPRGELRFPNGNSVTSTFALRRSNSAPALSGRFFYSTQIPVCLWFLAKNKHDGSVAVTELATAIVNLALRGIDADFGPENADTFRSNTHPGLRADYDLATAVPFVLSCIHFDTEQLAV